MSPARPSPSRRRFPALFLLALALAWPPGRPGGRPASWRPNSSGAPTTGPATVNHKLVDPALAAALRRNNFKWTNYYLITNLAAVIPLNQSRDLRMSDRCTLTVKNLGSSLVAVDWIGQGKPVSKGTNSLPCVYAGTNANDTAWFIPLRSLDDKK